MSLIIAGVDHQLNKGHYDPAMRADALSPMKTKNTPTMKPVSVAITALTNTQRNNRNASASVSSRCSLLASEVLITWRRSNDIRDQRRKEKLAYKEAQRKRSGKD